MAISALTSYIKSWETHRFLAFSLLGEQAGVRLLLKTLEKCWVFGMCGCFGAVEVHVVLVFTYTSVSRLLKH